MQDMQATLEKLLTDAEDCELISKLATDLAKRAAYTKLAAQFRAMAEELQAEMRKRTAPSNTP
jgi:hypothetical protein